MPLGVETLTPLRPQRASSASEPALLMKCSSSGKISVSSLSLPVQMTMYLRLLTFFLRKA